MAIGIDCMLISVALALLTSPPDVKKDIAIVARCMEAGTLVMSAGLNARAFTGGAFDAAHWAQVAFGCFVPAAISGATYIFGATYEAVVLSGLPHKPGPVLKLALFISIRWLIALMVPCCDRAHGGRFHKMDPALVSEAGSCS
jgi:hypothetical protein